MSDRTGVGEGAQASALAAAQEERTRTLDAIKGFAGGWFGFGAVTLTEAVKGIIREAEARQQRIAQLKASLREKDAEITRLRTLAKEATNGWACYAKRHIEHDEIARLHREIDALLSALPAQGGSASAGLATPKRERNEP